MNRTLLSIGTLLGVCSLLGALIASPPAAPDANSATEAELLQLREDFHLAGSIGDYELMKSLWTEDAVFNSPGGTVKGATNIADFFASNPGWGKTVSLTSESKTRFQVNGTRAYYGFECIIVRVDAGLPLETSLSNIPFGTQNPSVEIIQHSHSKGIAVYQGGRWKFQVFNGGAGPL
jgi:hypothetical protein